MKKVACFDIDGTVFRSSLLIELVEALIDAGAFPPSVRDEYKRSHEAWWNREGTYEAYIDDVVRAFCTHMRGMHYGILADVGRNVVLEQSKRVYRYTRDLISDLKAKDYFIVAVSQSPKTILDEFCVSYGFDKVYGRMYEIGPRDCFTGNVIDESIISDKALIIDRLLGQGGLTLDGSVGVGDTEGDIPLLHKVETPICFNPNHKLYEYARAHAWPVVVERKDVVYTI
jgi:HAD superfamily phosphoserine phosphatase-like hydrolase